MKIFSRLQSLFGRGTNPDDNLAMKGFIVAVVKNQETGETRILETHNIITDAGDIFYAQKGAGATPTNAFVNLVLGSGVTTPAKTDTYTQFTAIASTNKAPTATYPKQNDVATDNTGKGTKVVTYKYDYATTDFSHSAITEGLITIASPTGGSPVLCHFSFGGAFEKTTNDTLTVYVNHSFAGI